MIDDSARIEGPERERLQAEGYEPVEVWVRSETKFWDDVLVEAKTIARAEDDAEFGLFSDEILREQIDLMEEQEREAGVGAPW